MGESADPPAEERDSGLTHPTSKLGLKKQKINKRKPLIPRQEVEQWHSQCTRLEEEKQLKGMFRF